MRSFVVGVAGSVVASAIVYFPLAATEALSLPVRLLVMALVLVLGVVAAWLGSRGARDAEGDDTSVGDRIDAAGDVTVEGVDVERSGRGNTRVGTNITSGGTTRVGDVRVTSRKDRE